jgi:hypothetical protein
LYCLTNAAKCTAKPRLIDVPAPKPTVFYWVSGQINAKSAEWKQTVYSCNVVSGAYTCMGKLMCAVLQSNLFLDSVAIDGLDGRPKG